MEMAEMATICPAIETALDKFQALGSVRQIADYFTQENITGQRNVASNCPVANYLRRELTVENPIVLKDVVSLYDDESGRYEVADALPAVRGFITDFDNGHYPELAY